MMLLFFLLPVLALGQVDYVSECPEENGFFADALQCDRYYECDDGVVSEHFCPDGLVFDENIDDRASCGFPFATDCNGRNELQPAQPSPGCPRQHGYFAHQDDTVCNKFNFCVDGNPNTITCPGGLIFDPVKGQCAYSDQTDRKGCTSSELFQFRCPSSDLQSVHEHSRHPDPDDCQYFYLCIEGKARRNGCSDGSVFDPDSLSCERQDKVDGPCQNWYNQTFIDSLNIPEQSQQRAPVRTRPIAGGSRRRPAAFPRQSIRQEALPPQEPLPKELAALAGFGRQTPAGLGTTSTNFGGGFANFQSAPVQNGRPSLLERPARPSQTFESRPATPSTSSFDARPAVGSRGRVRQRQRGQLPQRAQEAEAPAVSTADRDQFFSSLRSSVGQGSRGAPSRVRQEEPVQEFSRPPPRRSRPEPIQEQEAPAPERGFQSFGARRRQPGRGDLLSQVEEEIARREQQPQQEQRTQLSRGPQFPRGRRRQEEVETRGRRRDEVEEEETQGFGGRRGVGRQRGGGQARQVETEEERYQAELAAEQEVRRKDAVTRAEAKEKYDADIAAELRRREEEEERRAVDAVTRAEAEARYQEGIAAELRAREVEAGRRAAELEVRRKDAVARAEAEEKYNAEIAAELEVRRKDAVARAKAKEKYDQEIAAELEVRRKDAVARAEAEERYNAEIGAELQRRKEQEKRVEEELQRRPQPRRRHPADGQGVRQGAQDLPPELAALARGRLQVIESARPPLQQFEEDETEFAGFSRGRQRNRAG